MRVTAIFASLLAGCCLPVFAAVAQEAVTASEADGKLEALQAERAADAKTLRSALESASTPEQRATLAAAFVERDQKRREQMAALAEDRVSALPSATPIPIEKRFEDIPDPTVKAALIARARAIEELSALRDETKNLSPEARAKKYTEWQEKHAGALETSARTLDSETRKESRQQPVVPAEPPAGLSEKAKTAWTQRAALMEELSVLRESTKTMSPEERSRAYAQWLTQNEGKLEEARQQLSQEIPQR